LLQKVCATMPQKAVITLLQPWQDDDGVDLFGLHGANHECIVNDVGSCDRCKTAFGVLSDKGCALCGPEGRGCSEMLCKSCLTNVWRSSVICNGFGYLYCDRCTDEDNIYSSSFPEAGCPGGCEGPVVLRAPDGGALSQAVRTKQQRRAVQQEWAQSASECTRSGR
jgi:hypothetical protein